MSTESQEGPTIDMDAASAELSASLFPENGADPDASTPEEKRPGGAEPLGKLPDAEGEVPNGDKPGAEAPAQPEKGDAGVNPAPKPENGDTPSPESQSIRQDDPNAYPKSWKKELSAQWEGLPAEVKAEIHRREKNFLDGTQQFREEAGIARKFSEVFQPYAEALRRHNVNPLALTQNLLAAQHTLAFGNAEAKQQLIRQLAQQYNVDLGSAATPPPEVAPEVASLQQQIAELQSREAQRHQALLQSEQTKLYEEAKTLATAKPYFNELVPDMTRLVKSGEATTLQDAYDKAVWLNPAVRAKEIERLNAEKTSATAQATAQAAAEAKRQQQLNPRTRTRSASPTAKTGSIEDTLKETLRSIEERA